MPGYIMHLATAKKIFELKGIVEEECLNIFLLGNIIPDMKKGSDKKDTHFWSDDMFLKFARKPELKDFKEKYGHRMHEPFVFGYYCHLYLDAMYMERYWDKKFEFFDDNMNPVDGFSEVKKIKLVETGEVYDREVFFSEDYYYGDYNRMNSYFIDKYNVISPYLSKNPDSNQTDADILNIIKNIEEFDSENVEKVLYDMIERISMLGHETLKLTVLDIDEMDKLIKEVALELAEEYKKKLAN